MAGNLYTDASEKRHSPVSDHVLVAATTSAEYSRVSPKGALCVTMRAFSGETKLTQHFSDECFGGLRVPFCGVERKERFANL